MKLKVKFTSVFLFILFAILSHGQTSKLDSLKNEVFLAEHDTTRCQILIEIGDAFKSNFPDSAIIYYNQCLELATRIKSIFFEAYALRFIGNVNSDLGDYKIAIENYDRSLNLFNKLGRKKEMSSCYNNIAIVNLNQGNYENAAEFFQRALEIDLVLKDTAGISLLYNNLAVINRLQGNYSIATEYLNKALALAIEIDDKKGIARCYSNLGNINSNQGDYTKAIDFHLKSLKIDSVLNYKKGMANSYGNIAIIYYNQGNYDSAIKNFEKSLMIFKELGDKNGISACHNNMGLVYNNQGKYKEAIECYLQSLKLSEESGIKGGIANSYANIGNVHQSQGNYEKAIEYHNKSLQIKEEIGDKKGVSSSFLNIGNVYQSQKNHDKALENYQKSLLIQEELNDYKGMSTNYNNMGSILTQKGNYREAIDYYSKSLNIRIKLVDLQGQASTYINIANLNINLADSVKGTERGVYLKNAIDYAQKGYDIAVEIGAVPNQNDAAATLQSAYKEVGKINEALYFAEIYIATRDSMFHEEKTKAITEMQTKYETEKKQQEIENQQLVIEKQEIDNKRQRTQRNFFIVGSVLLALLVLLIFRGYQLKKRTNIIITQKNALLEEANEEIRTQNEEISAQRDEIEAQRDMVMDQKERIELQNKHITDSINYAQRIQTAVLPRTHYADSILGEHFIFYKPKDIVSGDFYWATRINHWLIFTVADCTGHGVPGAFMSMLGVSFLKEIVGKKEVTQANEVLNLLRESIIDALQQQGDFNEQQDGMDMVLCVLNTTNYQLQYAGANNPLYIVNANKELTIIPPDKQPVAIHQVMKPFSNHEILVNKGDSIYLTSDGFQDQFGGPQNTKFMVKNLRDLLVSNVDKPMAEQKNILEETFENWKGVNPQIDDVTVMGVRI